MTHIHPPFCCDATAIHQEGFIDALFELVDLYTPSLDKLTYIDFAKSLKERCVVQGKDGEARLRRVWRTPSKPGAFLCVAIAAIKALLDTPQDGPAKGSPRPNSASRAMEPNASAEHGTPRKWRRWRTVVDVLTRGTASTQVAVAPVDESARPRHGAGDASDAALETRPGTPRRRAVWRALRYSISLSTRRVGGNRKAWLERAVDRLFDRWASPIYVEIDEAELRLRPQSYIGTRRHPDDERAIRLGDLALMLAEAGVALGKKGRKLPSLVALYRVLDYDGDGWITHSDFKISVLESKVDISQTNEGPTLPQSTVRGGPRRLHRRGGLGLSSRTRKGHEAVRPRSGNR